MKTKEKRNYDKERDELFKEAFDKLSLDKRIIETLELIDKIDSEPQNKFEIFTSSTGTTLLDINKK